MIITYLNQNDKIERSTEVILDPSTLWIDLVNMSREEEKLIENFLGIDIPSKEEMEQIEVSRRLYVENDATYFIMSLINHNITSIINHSVTFILFNNVLITVRYNEEVKSFNSFGQKLVKNQNNYIEAKEIFLELLTIIIEILADILQDVRQNIDKLNREIFLTDTSAEEKTNYAEVLKKIGQQGNFLSKTEESILSINRAINYSQQSNKFAKNEPQILRLATMLADLNSIAEHANFLSGSITFLLEALLGIIQLEQSNIVKLVSIVSLIFLPPTLIASIYGMNFEIMPELKQWLGYPITLLIMLISGWLPYKICKKKKWL
jgi:magnesium transporter